MESFEEEANSKFIQVKERMKSRWLTGVEVPLAAAGDVEEMCRWLRESFPKRMTAVSGIWMELRSVTMSLQPNNAQFSTTHCDPLALPFTIAVSH